MQKALLLLPWDMDTPFLAEIESRDSSTNMYVIFCQSKLSWFPFCPVTVQKLPVPNRSPSPSLVTSLEDR